MKTNQAGFSLIELLVVIAIMGVLSMIALPSFKSSLDKSKITDAISVTQQAVGRAKAIAIRNESGTFSNGADISTASVCLENSMVSIYSGNEACEDPDALVWQKAIDSSITVTESASSDVFVCMCFTSKSRMTNTATDCTACSVTNDIEFTHTSGEAQQREIF